MNPAAPLHHVFVDFENVPTIDLSTAASRAVQVTMLLGKSQKKLPVDLVQAMLRNPDRYRLIEMDFAGKNALDLALAYHVGVAAAANPIVTFHIVSRDKDFDPLVAHLRSAQIKIFRHDRFALPAILGTGRTPPRPKENAEALTDWLTIFATRLRKASAARPKRKATLLSLIDAETQGQLRAGEAGRIVDALCQRGAIEIDEKDRVTYPPADASPR